MPIWPFRSKQPRLQDEALADLPEMFLSNPDDPTPGSDSLDPASCDYAIESLRAVDEHLEVIRRHSPTGTTWHWLTYDDAVRLDARLGSIDQSLGTAAVLWDGREGFCFPLGKVVKYLENGAEDSVRVFARAIVARAREDA